MLSNPSADFIDITWTGTLPFTWGIYFASDVAIGDEVDLVDPASLPRDEGALTGNSIVAVGLDSSLTTWVTPASNVLLLP